MHPRKQIRGLFKDRLLNGGTQCQDRVFDTMTPPIDLQSTIVDEGPVMMVYCRHEESREEDFPTSREDGPQRRRLEISIEVLAVGTSEEEVDDRLDDIAEEIEALIEAWEIPGFLNADPLLVDTQIDVTDTQQRIVGGLFMSYHLKYWTLYRPQADEPFLPDDVFSAPNASAPDQIVDDDHDEWPAVP